VLDPGCFHLEPSWDRLTLACAKLIDSIAESLEVEAFDKLSEVVFAVVWEPDSYNNVAELLEVRVVAESVDAIFIVKVQREELQAKNPQDRRACQGKANCAIDADF
jgi:hypothetical protein